MSEIRIETAREILHYGYSLAAHCSKCERWTVLDLARLVRNGQGGETFIGRRPRCRVCGSPGSWQLRAPAYRGQ